MNFEVNFEDEKLNYLIERMEEALLKERPGVDQSKVIAEELKILYAIRNDNYKMAEHLYRDQEEVELARRKFEEDVKRAELDQDLKAARQRNEFKFKNRVDWVKVAAVIGMYGTVIVNAYLDVKGHIPGFKLLKDSQIFTRFI